VKTQWVIASFGIYLLSTSQVEPVMSGNIIMKVLSIFAHSAAATEKIILLFDQQVARFSTHTSDF